MLSIFRKYRESRMQNPSLLEVMLQAHPIICKYTVFTTFANNKTGHKKS